MLIIIKRIIQTQMLTTTIIIALTMLPMIVIGIILITKQPFYHQIIRRAIQYHEARRIIYLADQ